MNIVQARISSAGVSLKCYRVARNDGALQKKVGEEVDVDGCDAWRVAQLLWRDFRLGRLGCMAGSHCISSQGCRGRKVWCCSISPLHGCHRLFEPPVPPPEGFGLGVPVKSGGQSVCISHSSKCDIESIPVVSYAPRPFNAIAAGTELVSLVIIWDVGLRERVSDGNTYFIEECIVAQGLTHL